jgi:hypothetical protein
MREEMKDDLMRTHRSSLTIALAPVMATLISLLTATVTIAGAAAPPFESYKGKYEDAALTINVEHQKAISGLSGSYLKLLNSAITSLRAEGDPEPVMKAGAEKARFAAEGTVPNPPNDKLPQLIQDVQSRYHVAVTAAGADRDKRLARLIGKYVQALDRLMRQYTGSGNMTLAMEVKAEKKRMEVVLADIVSKPTTAAKVKKVGQPLLETRPETLISSNLRDGLILWLGFDKNERSKVTDKSDSGFDGVVNGAKWTHHGQIGGAYEFDGNGSVDLGDIMNDIKLPVTVSLWAWVNKYPEQRVANLFRSDTSSAKLYAGFSISLNQAMMPGTAWRSARGGDNRAFRRSTLLTDAMPIKKWVHFISVMNTDRSFNVYMDGKQLSSPVSGKANAIGHTSTHAEVGVDFFGRLDEVMVWDRALSESEVRRLYGAQK